MLAALSGLSRQLPDAARVELGESPALRFDPPVDLRRSREEYPVEEGAGVQLRRARDVSRLHRLLELGHVAGAAVGLEAHHARAEDEQPAVQLAAKPVQRLAERVARVPLVTLGPETSDQLVAAEPPAPGNGQPCQQDQALQPWPHREPVSARAGDRQAA